MVYIPEFKGREMPVLETNKKERYSRIEQYELYVKQIRYIAHHQNWSEEKIEKVLDDQNWFTKAYQDKIAKLLKDIEEEKRERDERIRQQSNGEGCSITIINKEKSASTVLVKQENWFYQMTENGYFIEKDFSNTPFSKNELEFCLKEQSQIRENKQKIAEKAEKARQKALKMTP